MKILSSSGKKKILEKLEEQYGISSLPHLLIQFGREKVRAYSGSLSKEELNVLDKNLRVESCGLYLLHNYGDEIRLSLDGIHILKEQISKNIIELDNSQEELWFHGKDIELEKDKAKETTEGFKILKHKDDFIGCGKLTSESKIIKNFMPKERRIKN